MGLRFLSALLAGASAIACDGSPALPDGGGERPIILSVSTPDPALEGSIVEVQGLALDSLGSTPELAIDLDQATVGRLPNVASDTPGTLLFELTREVVAALGDGAHRVEVRALGAGQSSSPFAIELGVATSIEVELAEGPSGEAHRNDVAVVRGSGIIGPTEGALALHFAGTFAPDAGGSMAIDHAVPVAPLERHDRTRGVVVLSTDLGGMTPGTFTGTVQLRATLRSGHASESVALDTTIHFNPPALYDLDTTEASLGRILVVSGAGFLGGPDRPTEATLIELEGTFTPAGGGEPEPFGPMPIVPEFVSGNEVEMIIEPELRGETLVSELFGHARGVFLGTATPITTRGVEEIAGDPVPFMFTLGAIRQVVHVRFLPGFYDSLRFFGLANAAPEIEQRVKDRMDAIYFEWNVDIRLEEPEDFSRTAYSILEIGGPDPNGTGLFGYDNTPGKDVGNLRLFDAIGGTNAETQVDGAAGYGGVFVDSYLYWSSHPELPGERPGGAPDPDPLFDEIFDPVRESPATRAEVLGTGEPLRVAQVSRAIAALAALIGETAAHELGHSFGMAQPYGAPTVYHNDFDGEGCLMDAGGDRPLGERMEQVGFAITQFCHEEPAYLAEILGR